MARYAVGVDLGGTKILSALVDDGGVVHQRHRMATPQQGPDSVVTAIAESVQSVLRASRVGHGDVVGVGVGAPGPLDPLSGVVFQPPNLAGWYNVPLADLLRQRVKLPVCVENDANAAALGEWWVGAGRGVHDLVYITVSTGIGGGLIINDALVHGVSGTAGEIGHMTIDIHGPRCVCGNTGCLEVLASGKAIARMAREAIAARRSTKVLDLAGGDAERMTAELVAAAARQGDAVAREVFDQAGTYVGVAVASLLNLLNPAKVVIGGGVSKAGDLLFDPVRRTARERAFERPARDADIVPSALGDDVGVVGTAAVVFLREKAEELES